jgi:hypothetical protein
VLANCQPVEVKVLHASKNRSKMVNLETIPIMGEEPNPFFFGEDFNLVSKNDE